MILSQQDSMVKKIIWCGRSSFHDTETNERFGSGRISMIWVYSVLEFLILCTTRKLNLTRITTIRGGNWCF